MMDMMGINDSSYDKKIHAKKPLKKIKVFPIYQHIEIIPTNEMIEAVLVNCNELEQLLILFLLETGARLNEALRLTDKDISPPDKIVLYRIKSNYHKLTARTLSFPLCLKGVDFTGRLFERWTEQPNFLKEKIKELGQPMWSLHSLRHRFARQLLARREPFFFIKEMLGLSSLANTQIYLHNVL
jgi:integrase